MPITRNFCGPTICFACERFDTDGVTGYKPECMEDWKVVSDSECDHFKKGIPSSYPVHQPDCQRGFRMACEALGI